MRKTGYLASLLNVPPLIFRFQFNPEILSEKRAFKYTETDFCEWGFDRLKDAKGFGKLTELLKDIGDWGSLMTATKPLKPGGGSPREFQLEFQLQVLKKHELKDYDALYARDDLAYDLAVLRSFINPALGLFDLFSITEFFKGKTPWKTPPECSFVYGDISLTCVMTDLNIKITQFDNGTGKPLRAEVTTTLKEQSISTLPSTTIDVIQRHFYAGAAIFENYTGEGGPEVLGNDLLNIGGKIFSYFS